MIWPGRALGVALLFRPCSSLALFVSDAISADRAGDRCRGRPGRGLRPVDPLGRRPDCSRAADGPGLLARRAGRGRAGAREPGPSRPSCCGCATTCPTNSRPIPPAFEVAIPGRRQAVLAYRFVPKRRGTYRVRARRRSGRQPAGVLAQAVVPGRSATEVRVYPDIHQLARYTMLARRDRLSTIGVRRSRRLGTDNEFERLRDYIEGDDPRHIDWRATARRRKLTCRAFQLNQSQRIIFLIDCGRLMAGDTGDGLSPLDHAFNAMLLLAHVALIRGDQVGLLAFSDRVRAYVAPGGGPRRIKRLVHSVHNVFPEMVESRYDRAFIELEQRCRKRSLVVLMTNLFDELNAQLAGEYLRNLTGRHLPLAVFLRDHDLFALADQAPDGGPGLYQGAAAASLLNWRERVLARLRLSGVLTLDVFPEELTTELVNRYLEIKARHLL